LCYPYLIHAIHPQSLRIIQLPEEEIMFGKVDTLDAPNNSYSGLWGSSPSDIWTVSSSNWDKSIFHFNGTKWTSSQVTGLYDLKGLCGFSADNIIVGADNGRIWRYNGNTWSFSDSLKKEGVKYWVIQNIWGGISK
jgi:hypothetical protein